MKKTTIIVMFITVLSKILGFVRESVLSSLFYGSVSDAYITAVGIPNTIINIIAAAFVTGIIPMLSRMKEEKRINNFTTNVVNIMLLIAGAVAMFIFIFPDISVYMLGGSGFKDETLQLTVYFVRIISFSVLSIVFVQIGSGYLNVKGSFIAPAAVAIPMNILAIIGMFVSSSMGNNMMVLIVFQLVGILAQGLFIFWLMRRRGFKYRPFIDFKDEDLRIMLGLSLPVIISSLVAQFNDIMMRNTASNIGPEGSITKLGNTFKMIGFVQGVFVTAILTVSYPNITRDVVADNKKMVSRRYNETILLLAICVVPAFIGFLVLPEEILSFAFGYGKVTPEIIRQMTPIFMAYAFNLIPVALRDLDVRMHYAYEDMMGPVKNAVLLSAIFIPTMLLSSYLLQSKVDLALASLAGSLSFATIIAYYFIHRSTLKHAPYLTLKPIFKDVSKMIVSALIMGAVLLLIKPTINGMFASKIALMFELMIAVIVYFSLLLVMRTQFFLVLLQSFLSKRHKGA